MGIDDPVQISKLFYQTSKVATSQLTQVIKEGGSVDISTHEAFYKETANTYRDEKFKQAANDVDNLLPTLSIERKIAVERKIKHKCSMWLTVAPTYENGFYTTPDVFRDAVAFEIRNCV